MKAPSSTPPPPSHPQPTLEQQLTQVRQQYLAVSELLWETVRTAAPDQHEIAVLPHASNPLWELCFVRVAGLDGKPDPSGRMRICAATIPEITEAEKKRVVRLLRDTDKPLLEALAELKLPHPPSYVELKIKDRLEWKPYTTEALSGARWVSVTAAKLDEKLKNLLQFPK